MPVESLQELAIRACLHNIKEITSIGDYLPYHTMREVLTKIESATQLHQIELSSPQIQGHTEEIWTRIIENDFPLEYRANTYLPPSPSQWYRVWQKYKKEHDAALKQSEEQLKSALLGLQERKEKNVSKIVDGKHLPPARRSRRFQPRDTATSRLTFGAGSRTKMHNGASVMKRVRREVKEIANIQGALSKAVRPAVRPTVRPPARTPAAQPSVATASATTNGNNLPPRAIIIDSDDEDDMQRYDDNEHPGKKAGAPGKHIGSPTRLSIRNRGPGAVGTGNATATTMSQGQSKAHDEHKPAITNKLTGRGAATLANKFGHRQAKPQPEMDVKPLKQHPVAPVGGDEEEQDSRRGSVSGTTQPGQEPATADGSVAPPTTQPVIRRRRKAVDHFIRPKRNRAA